MFRFLKFVHCLIKLEFKISAVGEKIDRYLGRKKPQRVIKHVDVFGEERTNLLSLCKCALL